MNGIDKLPPGEYRIGTYYFYKRKHKPWFNLYRKSPAGKYWDYYSKIPELDCRRYFGLHLGEASEGCITVTNENCFERLKTVITLYE